MRFESAPAVAPGPNGNVPLAAVVEFATDVPSRALVEVEDGRRVRRFEAGPAVVHGIPLLGLRFATAHGISVQAEAADGGARIAAEPLTFATPAMPDDFPTLRLRSCVPERREPGATMFNVRHAPGSEDREDFGLMLAVDRFGEIVWSCRVDEAVGDIRRLANGNVLFMTDGRLREIDFLGTVVGDWHAAGRWRGKGLPESSLEVDTETFHHGVVELPSGNFLVCGMEIREVDGFPTSDVDPEAGTAVSRVVGDVIVEFARDGAVENRYPLLDILDPLRVGYDSLSGYWERRGYADTRDWTHVNGLAHDGRDDGLLVSVRHQDCLIKIDRCSGRLKWILGTHANWRDPWKSRLLAPAPGLEWQYHQHDCSVTGDGTFLCFDNGNHRASPFDEKMSGSESYSRAVEFAVDENAGTVRQVWETRIGDPPEFACFQGGAVRLPETGNTFVTCGGICSADGAPSPTPFEAHCRARWVEIAPGRPGEAVFDLELDDDSEEDPIAWSSFRAEPFPAIGADAAPDGKEGAS